MKCKDCHKWKEVGGIDFPRFSRRYGTCVDIFGQSGAMLFHSESECIAENWTNKDNEPLPLAITTAYDGLADAACVMPVCPSCNEPTYDMPRCPFCGQPIKEEPHGND